MQYTDTKLDFIKNMDLGELNKVAYDLHNGIDELMLNDKIKHLSEYYTDIYSYNHIYLKASINATYFISYDPVNRTHEFIRVLVYLNNEIFSYEVHKDFNKMHSSYRIAAIFECLSEIYNKIKGDLKWIHNNALTK